MTSLAEFAPLERAFARRHGKDDATQLFLATLMSASRQGHLCIEYDGAFTVDPKIVASVGKRHYLRHFYELEGAIATQLRRLATTPPSHNAEAPIDTHELLPEQADVITHATKKSLTLVAGGPGTGKSYTAVRLLNHFAGQRIAVAAPTGKAAGNLQGALGDVPVQTLHRLLNSPRGLIGPLPADLILVDEASMIDIDLFHKLLVAVKPGARLILIGDPDQLPPVEAGSLFVDMLNAPLLSHCVTRLSKSMRARKMGLVELASAVNRGDTRALFVSLKLEGVARLNVDELELIPYLYNAYKQYPSFRVLSPVRKGSLGVERLNSALYEREISHWKRGDLLAVPILICRNDPHVQLANGDVGLLFRADPRRIGASDYALFGERRIAAPLLPPWELAYCLSVHKSQGSEYERVAVILPQESDQFGREVVYTALTRARDHLEVFATDSVIEATIQRTSKRMSGLTKRLSESSNDEEDSVEGDPEGGVHH